MPVTQESPVGLSSNPDARPANGSTTLVTTGNWADPQQGNASFLVGGRVVYIATRASNHYSKLGGT